MSEKLNLVSNLIEIAKADGMVNLSEISYIFWTTQRLQLSELELKRLFEKTAPLAVPVSTAERIAAFHTCTTILAIDGNVAEPEITQCAAIGKDLRLNEARLNVVFEQLKMRQGELLSLEELTALL